MGNKWTLWLEKSQFSKKKNCSNNASSEHMLQEVPPKKLFWKITLKNENNWTTSSSILV